MTVWRALSTRLSHFLHHWFQRWTKEFPSATGAALEKVRCGTLTAHERDVVSCTGRVAFFNGDGIGTAARRAPTEWLTVYHVLNYSGVTLPSAPGEIHVLAEGQSHPLSSAAMSRLYVELRATQEMTQPVPPECPRSAVYIGLPVFALGYKLGYNTPLLRARGKVVAYDDSRLVLDMTIAWGMSGGGVYTADGQWLGLLDCAEAQGSGGFYAVAIPHWAKTHAPCRT